MYDYFLQIFDCNLVDVCGFDVCILIYLEDELMDAEEKVRLVLRGLDEVITVEDLQSLFEVESRPKAYIGVEPSG